METWCQNLVSLIKYMWWRTLICLLTFILLVYMWGRNQWMRVKILWLRVKIVSWVFWHYPQEFWHEL